MGKARHACALKALETPPSVEVTQGRACALERPPGRLYKPRPVCLEGGESSGELGCALAVCFHLACILITLPSMGGKPC